MFVEVVGLYCYLRLRCRYAACVVLGNAYKLRLIN
jgi:hypothetical protein